jgi:putative endonuclease
MKDRSLKMYYVYIVKCADDTLYTGISTQLERRIEEHNSSDRGAKYTRVRRPVELVYSEEYPDRSSASKREYEIKKRMTREKKLALIAKMH